MRRAEEFTDTIDDSLGGQEGQDLPIGFGLTHNETSGGQQQTRPDPDAIHWIRPLDSPAVTPAHGDDSQAADSSKDDSLLGNGSGPLTETSPDGLIPRYTIPAGSHSLGATAWSALVGRVARGSTVDDPYSVKLLTGPTTLAANGHLIPDLAGMIWRGIARGDWGMSCVRAQLTTVTYVFRDGTVRTVSGSEDDPLGTITDN
jgi:integrating conjugative element protein (TIGR03752 family)